MMFVFVAVSLMLSQWLCASVRDKQKKKLDAFYSDVYMYLLENLF